MRKLIFALLALPVVASAATATVYIRSDLSGYNDVIFDGSSTADYATTWNPAGTAPNGVTDRVYSVQMGTVTISGTVTWNLYPYQAGGGTVYFGVRHGGVDTDLCSAAFSMSTGLTSVSCTASGQAYNGDLFYWKASVSSGTPIFSGNTGYYGVSNMTFTYNYPPLACACGNDCGGASCGNTRTVYSVYTQAICDCGSSCNGTPPAPGSFACVMAGGVNCSWGATSGAAYVLTRDGTTIYSGNSTSYSDLPSAGTHTYNVHGTGYCTPSSSASFNTGTTNPLTATATTLGSKSGAILGCW